MQNRQKDELVRDILTVSNGGATITNIMFKAFTSHAQAKAYLGELIENGFVEYDALDRKYRSTPKGLEYLQVAEKMFEMLAISDIRRSVASSKNVEIYQF